MRSLVFIPAVSALSLIAYSVALYSAPQRDAVQKERDAFQKAPSASVLQPPAERALLNQYCVTCHNQKLKTAGLTLDNADVEHVGDHADTWEKVVRKLHGGTMPPLGMPRPDSATLDNFASSLETALDRAAISRPEPGRASLHRLNRAEYANAIRDLLDLKVDVATLLPADDESNGFDNIADVLKVSPSLLEQYLSASRAVSSLAVGDRSLGPVSQVYQVPPESRPGGTHRRAAAGYARRHPDSSQLSPGRRV